MTPISIKQTIDSCFGKSMAEKESVLSRLLSEASSFALQNYSNSREIIQAAIGQLDREHDEAVIVLIAKVLNQVNLLKDRFSKYVPSGAYVQAEWTCEEIRAIWEKVFPLLGSHPILSTPNMTIADSLTMLERQKTVSFIIDSIQHYGTSVQWDKNTLENHQLYFNMLYPICKKDEQLNWVFYYGGNFIDRLATSQFSQAARDMAETLLMIGYQEGMEGEAYFCVARAYTISGQPLAGLLYLHIALQQWLAQSKRLAYKLSFEILWQVLKIARDIYFCSEKHLRGIVEAFDDLNPPPYDVLSFYHTYLSVLFFAKQEKVLDDVADFLDGHRELFFQNLEHSAMPWITLVATVKLNFPQADVSRLQRYINAAKSVVDYKSNALYFDLFEKKNLERHLKELMVKLQQTRANSDYSHDNRLAMLYAKYLLDEASQNRCFSFYLLAMHVRADFTFVRPLVEENGLFRKSTFEDVKGDDYHLSIEDQDSLEMLMQQGEDNEVLWIGKGADCLHSMSLFRHQNTFGELPSLGKQDFAALQKSVISQLIYAPDEQKPGQPYYEKDKTQLESEADDLKNKLSVCQISVMPEAERLLIVKDMDIASYPHQLLVNEQSNQFVGSQLPSCNLISTEVFIKTNFEEPLHKDFSCAYWSPIDSQEFTFIQIKSKLEDVLQKYHFLCNDLANPQNPICSEINIACAHGGADISNTSWFYAAEKPIVETEKIIGKGKLLILFVCHSGTISRQNHDNAMHTLIKRYMRGGYSAVIAPMWSLNTTILPTWLAAFMEEMARGEFVIDALYRANMKVKEEYTSPEVYACLHLFGNPFLRIDDKPILQMKTETNA